MNTKLHSLLALILVVLALTHVGAEAQQERDLLSYPSLYKLFQLPHRSASGKRADLKSCTVYKCAYAGESCGTINLGNSIVETDCNGNNVCNITSTSSNGTSTGKCLANPGPGESCAGSGSCVDGYKCDAKTHMCVLDDTSSPYTTGPGTPCKMNEDCYYLAYKNNTLVMTDECVNGVCRFTPDGEKCSVAGAQCNGLTSFCNTTDSKCHKNLKDGDKCTVFQAGCAESCIPINNSTTDGFCAPFYSSDVGKCCAYDSDCVEGSLCMYPDGGQVGTCQKPKTSSSTFHKPCSSDSNCNTANMEYCGCDSRYGASPVCVVDVTPAGYTAAYSALQTCTGTSGCTLHNGDVNTTCLFTVCLKQACSLYKIIGTSFDVSPNCFVKNTLLPLCSADGGNNGGASTDVSAPGTTSSSAVYVSISHVLYVITFFVALANL